jgi:Na+/glutamate symporter
VTMPPSLWVPLIAAGIALVGTVAGSVSGVLVAQRGARRREAENWERERERERERWAREDAARTFEATARCVFRFL